MTVEIRPAQLAAAWSHGDDAASEMGRVRGRTSAAAGSSMGRIADVLATCADDVDGALEVAEAVLTEHRSGSDDCVARFQATDGAVAGEFDGLL